MPEPYVRALCQSLMTKPYGKALTHVGKSQLEVSYFGIGLVGEVKKGGIEGRYQKGGIKRAVLKGRD